VGTYYLDIETTGLDEVEDKIITIQYVELERGTGKPLGELTILKEWELGEKEMLRRFIDDSPILNPQPFDFVPICKLVLAIILTQNMGLISIYLY
jgi:DNA polymerase III epsilon subunit-like protein